MKLLFILGYLLLFAFPFYLLYHRKVNVTLIIFYSGLGLFTLGGFQSLSIPQIIFGICGFAFAAGMEFVIRRELRLAAFATSLLLFIAYSWYYAAEQGAFA